MINKLLDKRQVSASVEKLLCMNIKIMEQIKNAVWFKWEHFQVKLVNSDFPKIVFFFPDFRKQQSSAEASICSVDH